jgi:type I restriction enzyme M protein
MITGQIKNQIDQIWDTFWTGGITNSIDILEQMTYLFFMKLLDDKQTSQEATATAFGLTEIDNPTFGSGTWHNPDNGRDVPYSNLRWQNFKNLEGKQMFDVVSQDVFSFIKHLNSGKESAYSRFMESAIFLIQSPRTLIKVVEGINSLDMNNRDTMGDVYEYILGKMAASGNNGQFRTPRHIIRLMVELMKPTLNDTICDPAMGSAGFIVESAKYITENYKTELKKKDRSQHFRTTMLNGFDTDPKMLRIGAMNLMLHGVDNPNVEYRDSLSVDNTDSDRYSLILANPPFAGSIDNEAVSKSLLAIAKTKKTELLFLSLFLRSLQIGGRCASIVPDGVLTGSSKAHQTIRKEIVDHNRLIAVISMPSGVFQPYSGVSTAIMVFQKTNAGGTDKVWFYDMRADGFSLDQKRTEVSENDIPDIIARFANLDAEANRKRTEQSFLVPVEEIQEHGYDLAFNTYKETVRAVVTYEKPEVILAEVATLAEKTLNDIKVLRSLIANNHEA